MNVRMVLKILSPGVEHTEEADLCAKMLWIGVNFQQGCGAGSEQEVVDDLLVLQGQPRQLMGNGEDDMYVVDWQQFLAASGEPLVASVGLALGTVSGAAGVERDGLMAALAAAVQMTTERRRAAVFDGEQDAHGPAYDVGALLANAASPESVFPPLASIT